MSVFSLAQAKYYSSSAEMNSLCQMWNSYWSQ